MKFKKPKEPKITMEEFTKLCAEPECMEGRKDMTEFTLTLAENGYILDYNGTQPTRMVFEGGNELPLRLMKELLCDVTELIESGECEKIKITINVEKGEEDDKTTH